MLCSFLPNFPLQTKALKVIPWNLKGLFCTNLESDWQLRTPVADPEAQILFNLLFQMQNEKTKQTKRGTVF